MWILVTTHHHITITFEVVGTYFPPSNLYCLYLYFAKLCGPWSVFATTLSVHAFVNEFTASPAGWRRSQKPGSIRPAHGELPSQVGVMEYITQMIFLKEHPT